MNKVFIFLFFSIIAFGANAKELECSFYEETDEQIRELKDKVVFDYRDKKNGLKVSSKFIFKKFKKWTVITVEHDRQRVIAYSNRRIPSDSLEFPVLLVEIDYAKNALIYEYYGGYSSTAGLAAHNPQFTHDCKRLD